MKSYVYVLDELYVEKFSMRINAKIDVFKLLFETFLYLSKERYNNCFNNYQDLERNLKDYLRNKNNLLIYVKDKMSRLFFCLKDRNKIFSIHVPKEFHFEELEDEKLIRVVYVFPYSLLYAQSDEEIIELNEEIISNILDLLFSDEFDSIDVLSFLCKIEEKDKDIKNIWTILKTVFLLESGYIRYEYDMERHDKKNPNMHPENHYDIFYTEEATFKIGSNKKLDIITMIDLLNNKTEKYFLND